MSTGISVAAAAALAIVFPLPGYGSDVGDVAKRAAVAYATDDLPALRALSVPRAVQIDVEQTARIECHELKGVVLDAISGDDDAKDVRVTIVRTPSPTHLRMKLRRDGDRWRLAECAPAEHAAARELIADPAQWNRLLFDEPALLGRELAFSLSTYASIGDRTGKARAAAAALNRLAALRGDAVTRSLAATAEGIVAEVASDLARAKERAAEAVALARKSDDAETLVRALLIQSRVLERGPNGAQALAVMEEALPLIDRVTNRFVAASVLVNIGNLEAKEGKYAEAFTYFQRALAISTEIDAGALIMQVETFEALILQRQGEHKLAVAHLLRAETLGAGDPANDAWRGQNFIALAQSYAALERSRESMEALRKAEELGERSKASIVIGEAHRLRGRSYRRAGDSIAATREIEQALSVFEAGKRIRLIPGAMLELALTRLEAGNPRSALEQADRCVKASLDVNAMLIFIHCRTLAGQAHRALGETDAALADFREAIAASEERRHSLIGDARQRTQFFPHVISPYLDAADILAERGDAAAALELAEQARSRTLLDILAGDVSHGPNALTPQEEQRNDELAVRIAALNRRLRDEKNKAAAEPLTREIAAARADFESYQLVLDAAHPQRRTLRVPQAKPEDVLPLLGRAAAIVEYVVNGDRVRAFVITTKGVQSFRLRIGARDLDALARRLSEALAHADVDYRNDARALYATLLQPLQRALRGKKTLCIVPDGSLWRLPFEALVDGKGRFVAESYTCFYAPSMSVLAQVTGHAKRRDGPPTLLAVGAARLHGTFRGVALAPIHEAEEEVRALRSLYGSARSRVYLGRAATKEKVTGEMQRSRVLHFATHAIFDEENPMYSEVVLAESPDARDDGLLAAWEIMRLDLRADIAVLSACETARGGVSAGEGVIGFTWALFVAGCPSSVVSEWKADSASTKRLMVAFHRTLLRSGAGGVGKAEALRAAKLSLLHDPSTRNPFYWAAFVLVGSPRMAP